MLEERKKILDKVCKLLTLSESTTHEGEKESASKLASKLMAEFEISEGELNVDEIIEVDIEIDPKKKVSRNNFSITKLRNIISKYCGVYLLVVNGRYKYHKLIGKPDDIDAAIYMIKTIEFQVKKLAYDFHIRNLKPGMNISRQKNSYIFGLIQGVQYNLDKINAGVFKYKQESGLVPINNNLHKWEKVKKDYNKKNDVTVQKNNTKYIEEMKNEGFKDSSKIKLRMRLDEDNNEKVKQLSC